MKDWLIQARKLKNIRRCGIINTVSSTSVAEHSYYTALIAYDITTKLLERGVVIQTSKVLMSALMHDLAETITGDIPHPFKMISKDLKQKIKDVETQAARMYFPEYVDTHINAKIDESIEAVVVHAADFLELYLYCVEEQLLGNKQRYIFDIMERCREICEEIENGLTRRVVLEYFEKFDNVLSEGGMKGHDRAWKNNTERS